MATSEHDRIAQIIAKKLRTPYNPSKGADIPSPEKVVEVETDRGTLAEGIRQLQGYKRPRYLAVPERLVNAAVTRTRRTKIGVMNAKGKVVKRAQRPARRRR